MPLSEDVEAYFQREVKPHAPDAWIDDEKTKVGYEIPFTRHFYVFTPPRPITSFVFSGLFQYIAAAEGP